ncbi:MAG: FecR domain-containing protein [Saezia sp.]
MKFIKHYLISIIVLFVGSAYAETEQNIADISYVVQPGDTLFNISEKYLDGAEHWRKIAGAGNITEPRKLQPGSVISLPVDLLKHEDRQLLVTFQRGSNNVVVDGVSKPLARGMTLTEGYVIYTGADSFVSLELPDQSRVYLSANTVLRIKQFRYVPSIDKELIDFVLEEGHVETSVKPQADRSRFRVSTPLMVTGVRGTEFGVSFDRSNRVHTNNVTQGSVGIAHAERINASPSSALVLDAGKSAMITAGMSAPRVNDLLPAPDVSAWPKYIHTPIWTPVIENGASAAEGYVVRIFPVADETNVIFESRGRLVPMGPIYDDGVYKVQVRTLDKDGIPGYPATHLLTVKTKPAAPLLQSPIDQAQLPVGEQTLLCTNTANVWRYFLQLSQDEAFSNVLDEQLSSDGCSFTLALRRTGSYFWRVAALDGVSGNVDAARGGFSATGSFDVVSAPSVPVAMQERAGNGVTLRWPEVVPGSTYTIEVADNMNFSTIAYSHKTAQTEAFLELPSSCYELYIRMKSISPQGFESDFSDVRVLQGTATWCAGDGTLLVDGQGVPINVR